MAEHILDRPVWTSLTSSHAEFSVGAGAARRFESDISPFAAARDESPQSLGDLAELIGDDAQMLIAQAQPIIIPSGTSAQLETTAYQMIYNNAVAPPITNHAIVPLTTSDSLAMQELAALTRPGPFLQRTHLLGEFWGVKKQGQLIAMAGERLKQPGYTEISGVCTHPDFQGKGLGSQLCIAVLHAILERGETPYLHVFSDNTHAIKLYQKLGFSSRKTMHVAVLEKA